MLKSLQARKIILLSVFISYILGDYFFHWDDLIQSLFYVNKTNEWTLVDHDNFWRGIFYEQIKIVIYLLCAGLLVYFLTKFKSLGQDIKKRFYLFFLVMAFVPLSAVALKNLSRIDCPYDLMTYGGTKGSCHVFRPCYQPWSERDGHCFPAGHASGGFALISLRLLSRRKKLLTASGLFFGFVMGLYQILHGAHFFSHTIATMMISFLCVWSCEYYLEENQFSGAKNESN
jgi:membrane-associated PAP2 superfamily phosphatase